MTRTIAVCNQKGGVGKTTLTAGLAEVLTQRLGLRVLLIDADPQANTTSTLAVESPEFTLNDVLAGEGGEVLPGVIAEAITPSGSAWQPDARKNQTWPAIEVVAAERALAGREQDQILGREHRLRTACEGAVDAYDVVLIDCPPSLGQLTVNALVAADSALLVTEARASSVEGLGEIIKTLGSVRQHFNPGLSLAGVVVNRLRKDRKDQSEWLSRLEEDYEAQLLHPYLPEREKFAAAHSAAMPLNAYASDARELLSNLETLASSLLKD